MSLFEMLEATSLAIWINESLLGYPLTLASHTAGLAIMVGINVMINLRVVGVTKNIPYSALYRLFKYAWAGLLINVISGFSLFSAQATWFVTNIAFLIKITAVAVGAILSVYLCVILKRSALSGAGGVSTGLDAKLIAYVSLVVWLIAITGGRMIAYIE